MGERKWPESKLSQHGSKFRAYQNVGDQWQQEDFCKNQDNFGKKFNVTACSATVQNTQHHLPTFANVFKEIPTDLTNANLKLQSSFLHILSQY